MSTPGAKKGKKLKGRTVDLNEFLTEGKDAVKAGFALVQKKIDWSEDMIGADLGPIMLPTATIAARGVSFDDSKVPKEPPFNAFIGNLAFEATEEDVTMFFKDQKIESIRLVRDSSDRFKGFGYVEFKDRRSLIEALNLDGEKCRTRTVKINLPNESDDKGGYNRDRNNRGGFGGSRNQYESELPSDWRASAREERGSDRYGDRGGDRYGDRERYGGDRSGFGGDRGGFGDRGGEDRNWRSRDAPRGGSSRYERSQEPSESSAPAERPRLNLAPRTKPVDPIQIIPQEEVDEPAPPVEKPKIEKPKASDIFGAAKPVDTAAKLREIEERQRQKEAEEQKREQENNNQEQSRQPKKEGQSSGKGWRDEGREEKDTKKERKPRSERRVPAATVQDDEPVVVSSKNMFANLEISETADSDEETA